MTELFRDRIPDICAVHKALFRSCHSVKEAYSDYCSVVVVDLAGGHVLRGVVEADIFESEAVAVLHEQNLLSVDVLGHIVMT